MSMIRARNRGNELDRLHRGVDDLIKGFFSDWDMPFGITSKEAWPAIDVAENDNEITVKAEVAGCKPEDIDISVHGNSLRIKGEKKKEDKHEEKGYYHLERSYGSFERTIPLPSSVEVDKIEANCKDGVLEVKVPKKEKSKPVKIDVKGE